MQVGISTASLFGKYNTEDILPVLNGMGVRLAEINLSTFSEYEPSFARVLNERLGNIVVHSVHTLSTQFEPQLFNLSARVRDDAEALFRKVCACGQLLGARYYTFHGPVRLKTTAYRHDYDALAATLNRLIGIAAEYGLTLSYENVHWTYFSAPEYFAELKIRCPDLGATLDIKQARQSGKDVYEYLDVMADRITTVHVCDCIGVETALPGHGEFDFARLIGALKSRNVAAPLLLEAYAKDYDTPDELRRAFDLLTELSEK